MHRVKDLDPEYQTEGMGTGNWTSWGFGCEVRFGSGVIGATGHARQIQSCCAGCTSGIRKTLRFRQKDAAGLGMLVGWQEMAAIENWKGCCWIGSGCELNQGINSFSCEEK